jgi:quinol monooxygenase YgiN
MTVAPRRCTADIDNGDQVKGDAMTVARLYRLEAAEGKATQLEGALSELAGRVRPIAGCQGVEILRSTDNGNHFILIEKWDSIDAHKRGAKSLGKEAVSPMMAVIATPPLGAYLEYLSAN